MGLNDIRLSPPVAAALYRSSLIDANTNDIVQNPETVITAAEPVWEYLGNNKKNILFVVNYSNATYLPDEELSFLTNILTASKLDLGDVAIINLRNYPQKDYKDILNHFNSKTIFLFGIEPVDFGLPVDFPHFQVQSFANNTFLYTPALEERHSDKLFKSKLWVCLQRIFGI